MPLVSAPLPARLLAFRATLTVSIHSSKSGRSPNRAVGGWLECSPRLGILPDSTATAYRQLQFSDSIGHRPGFLRVCGEVYLAVWPTHVERNADIRSTEGLDECRSIVTCQSARATVCAASSPPARAVGGFSAHVERRAYSPPDAAPDARRPE